MKKNSSKKVTLLDVFKAVKDVKRDIKFLRKDGIDMEDHLNGKIKLVADRVQSLETESTSQHNELKNILCPRVFYLESNVEKIKKIHPQYTHQPLVA